MVGHRRTDNRQDFSNPLIVAYYTIDYEKNPKGTNYWRNRILKVAKQYKDKITFAISSKDDFQHELNEYGIDFVKGDKPVIVARNSINQKFIMKDAFRYFFVVCFFCKEINGGLFFRCSVEAFEKFVNSVLDGTLEPFVKSEPIPENNNEPVKVAVANNFREVVTDNEKDTLIEFYAPWCGHCKKLAPTYDELAQKLAGEDVAIVKMDATANDVPHPYDVRGFPTLYWAPKDSKDTPVKYEVIFYFLCARKNGFYVVCLFRAEGN